jgi:hypothetical protein
MGGSQGSSYGGSQGSSYGGSQGTSLGSNQGTSLGASQTTSDIWGAQQPGLQQLYAQAGQLASGQGQYAAGANQVAGQAQNAWLQQLTPGGNPYFSISVEAAINQATQGFNREVLPALDARGVAVGQYGGARDNLARGEAAGLFGQGLANSVAGMYSNQYSADQQRASAALGASGQIQGMQTAPLSTAAGIIGGPTVLSQQQALSQAQNTGYSQAQNTAYNEAQNNAYNQSQNSAYNQANNSASNYGEQGAQNFGENTSNAWGNTIASAWNEAVGQQLRPERGG